MQRKVSVLLIEDDPDYALLMSFYVSEACGGAHKYELQTAPRLDKGLALLKNQEIDVVLLDLLLPDCEGVETLMRLRREAPSVPVLVLTSLDAERTDLRRRSLAAGARDFLVKGKVDAPRLQQAIAYALEARLPAQRLAAPETQVRTTSAESLHSPS